MQAGLFRASPEPRTPCGDVRGRHRVRVELNRLNQEIALLQEELQLLEQAPSASKACKEVVEFVTNTEDPLLSNSAAPDRWFETPSDTTDCCCWH